MSIMNTALYNCFIRWVLILSWNRIRESNWSFDLLHGQQADNIRRSILKTQERARPHTPLDRWNIIATSSMIN